MYTYSRRVTRIIQTMFASGGVFISTLFTSSAIAAEPPIYISNLSFSEETPTIIEAREYEPLTVTIRGEKSIVASFSLSPAVSPLPSRLDIRMLNRPMVKDSGFPTAPPSPKLPLRLPGLPAGEYLVSLWVGDEARARDSRRLTVSVPLTPLSLRPVVDDETQRMTIALSQAWISARFALPIPIEEAFYAWQAGSASAPTGSLPVHLFVNNAAQPGYFFTAKPSEIALLRTIRDFTDEGPAFRALAPEGGACPLKTKPIYRALQSISVATHRYTAEASAYANLVESGEWIGEGVAFCVPTY
jgi:Repeat of unknown function (DUF5648)